jgi:tripartite-type tricarboxylate transporter receptor subunit TctC
LAQALKDPEFRRSTEDQGSIIVEGLMGSAFARFISADQLRWKSLIDAAGIQPQ